MDVPSIGEKEIFEIKTHQSGHSILKRHLTEIEPGFEFVGETYEYGLPLYSAQEIANPSRLPRMYQEQIQWIDKGLFLSWDGEIVQYIKRSVGDRIETKKTHVRKWNYLNNSLVPVPCRISVWEYPMATVFGLVQYNEESKTLLWISMNDYINVIGDWRVLWPGFKSYANIKKPGPFLMPIAEGCESIRCICTSKRVVSIFRYL